MRDIAPGRSLFDSRAGSAATRTPDRGRFKPEYEDAWNRKLADFTEFRLPEMGVTGIDMQVLSLTVPGLQADVAAGVAADDARFANDYLASVVAEHPTRFAAFAACRCRIRQPRSPSWTAASAPSVSVTL